MKVLLRLSAAIDWITAVIGRATSWLILATVLISTGNAFIRKLGSVHIGPITLTSSNAWLEAQWYLFSAVFLLAAAYALQRNDHVRIDIIFGALPRRAQHWINMLGHTLMLLPFAGLIIYYAVPFTLLSYRQNEYSSSAGGLVIWPVKALVLAGFVLLFLQGISEIVKLIAIMRGDIPDPNEAHSQQACAVPVPEPKP